MIQRTHVFLPDTQVKPGHTIKHLVWAGKYIASRMPDVLVMAGDWHDMPSLSSYDKGKRSFEGRRYKADIDAGNIAAERFDWELTRSAKLRKKLRKVITLGNHEHRIERAANDTPELEGTLSTGDLAWEDLGWEVYPFLEVAHIDGISYSHFFPRGANGNVFQTKRGAPSARAQVIREGRSATAGHQQGLDVSCIALGGRLQWGLVAGSFYLHHEDYLGPQGNAYYRGLVVKHNVYRGEYNPMFVDIGYLREKYGRAT